MVTVTFVQRDVLAQPSGWRIPSQLITEVVVATVVSGCVLNGCGPDITLLDWSILYVVLVVVGVVIICSLCTWLCCCCWMHK